MFDAKSLLENLVKGASPAAAPSSHDSNGPELSDLLGKFQKADSNEGSAELGDLLGKLQSMTKEGSGGVTDIIGNVFSQATKGVQEGAHKIDDATGAGDALSQITQQLAGKSPEEMMAFAKEFMAKNQLGTGAALGGLGALILGTTTGRSIAVGAAKMGALALISGLAFKAYQNYAEGKPLIDGMNGETPPAAPPEGSGFETENISNEQAALYIKAMIAAAAADGRVDAREHETILGGLKQAGLDARAEEFLAREFNNPASIDEIAAAVSSKEEAVKIYTAARLAIDPDTGGENAFLALLAQKLGIEPELAKHINAAAGVS